MFNYKTRIHLRDTDATGVLYFAEQFRLCLEAFENYLGESQLPLQKLIDESAFLLPIVHAESDYALPLYAGDEISIALSVGKIGTTSFTLQYKLFKQGKEAGHASIVHVTVSQETQKPVPIPEKLSKLLSHLQK
ncbi:MAG: acyl-CoA thioesterase [Chlamydiales bacterium]|nr:acyl-CoA thioesterase [Chlamydiales bacterium]